MQDLHSDELLDASCFSQQEADPCADLLPVDELAILLNDMETLELQTTRQQTDSAGRSTVQQLMAPEAPTTPSLRSRRNNLRPLASGLLREQASRRGTSVPRRRTSTFNKRIANRESQRRWRQRQTVR